MGGGEQYVEVVPQMEKQRRLEQILRSQERGSKVIIFCSTKRLCDQLARNLGRGFGAAAIHGDKSQGERDWVLNQFRSGKPPILVATDVAARGLDIKDIRWASFLLFSLWYQEKILGVGTKNLKEYVSDLTSCVGFVCYHIIFGLLFVLYHFFISFLCQSGDQL